MTSTVSTESSDSSGSIESMYLLDLKTADLHDSTHAKYNTYNCEEHTLDEECDQKPDKVQTSTSKSDNINTTEQKETSGHFIWKIKLLLKRIPRRKILVLLLCVLANFLSTSAFALIAPFFPSEARKKGMSLATIGIVFSVYQLVGLVVSPIIGNYLNRIGAKFVYLAGLFVCGTSVVCFGVLDKGPDGYAFTVMCILCRCSESLGASAFTTASTAIVSSEFPDHIGTVVSFLNAGSSLGLMAGPVVGGLLYEAGGYGMPFYVIALLSVLDAVFIYFFLPELNSVEHKRKKSMFGLMKSPRVFVPVICVAVGIGGIAIYDTTFAILVEPFKLSASAIGMFYLLASGCHTVMLPVWGFLADSVNPKELLMMLGLLMFGFGFLIDGPSPLLPFVPFELWSVGLGFALLGFSLGGIIIVALACMTDGAHGLGYEKNLDTNALVSGLYYSGYSLGGFVGPMVGSLVVQNYGFPYGFTIIGLVSVAVAFLVLCFLMVGCCCSCSSSTECLDDIRDVKEDGVCVGGDPELNKNAVQK